MHPTYTHNKYESLIQPLRTNCISCIKVTCSKLQQSNITDAKLLAAISEAVGVYYNSTGKAKCFDTGHQAVSSLGDKGWNFQVRLNNAVKIHEKCMGWKANEELTTLFTVV